MSELERSLALAIPRRTSQEVQRTGPPIIDAAGPARIMRTGTDNVEVDIGAMSEPAEIAAVVSRIEQLLDAGDDTVDVVAVASTPHPGPIVARWPADDPSTK